MARTLVPRRPRPTRLDFDGGPWMRGFPLAWSSPWAELAAACATGLVAGMILLPDPSPVRAIGWVGWVLLAPVGALVWLLTGTGAWPISTALLGPLGWALLSVAVADLLQATLPLTFGRRVAAAALGAPALAFAAVALLSLLPWHLLPWAG